MNIYIKIIIVFLFVIFTGSSLQDYGGKILPSNPMLGAIIIFLLVLLILFYEDLNYLKKMRIKLKNEF